LIPVAGASTWHSGIDIAAPAGSPIVAPTDLKVVFAGVAGGYGNAVYAVDELGNQHRFAHMRSYNVGVGDTLSQGDYIGAVGSTGNSSGNHLHYEIRDQAGKLLKTATEAVINEGKKLAGKLLGDNIGVIIIKITEQLINHPAIKFTFGFAIRGIFPSVKIKIIFHRIYLSF